MATGNNQLTEILQLNVRSASGIGNKTYQK